MTTLRDYQQKNAVLFKTHFVRGFVTHISVGIYLQQENTVNSFLEWVLVRVPMGEIFL